MNAPVDTSEADIGVLRAAEAALSRQGPLPLPLGPLAPIVAGVVRGSSASDWWIPGWHERPGAALRGVAVDAWGTGAEGARPYRVGPVIEGLGLRAVFAVGLAQAEGRRVVVHLGEAALADGDVHEALNLAALQRAPVTFVIALWDAATLGDAAIGVQLGPEVVRWASAYAPVAAVDGTASAVAAAVASARTTEGPRVILARVLRN